MASSPAKAKKAPQLTRSGRRGRPTADRVAAIEAAIRSAALEAFLEAGFAAASMDAIAAAARVAKGTLYARYESKELLFRAVLEEELERWSQRAGAEDHLLPPALEPRLRHHARTIMGVFGWPEYQRFARLIDSTKLTFPEINGVWQEIAVGRYVGMLAREMAETPEAADVALADRTFFARLFLHAITGWYLTETAGRPVEDSEAHAFADRVIATIMAALAGARR